jgi:uncharacterized phage protein (TIGR01671 family)
MREFKFRVWDGQRMREADNLLHIAMGGGRIYDTNHAEPYTEVSGVLMQSTGLHDAKGKEIYEGDIIQDDILNVNDEPHRATIVWHPEYASFVARFNHFPVMWEMVFELTDGVVIGNVYENPELR